MKEIIYYINAILVRLDVLSFFCSILKLLICIFPVLFNIPTAKNYDQICDHNMSKVISQAMAKYFQTFLYQRKAYVSFFVRLENERHCVRITGVMSKLRQRCTLHFWPKFASLISCDQIFDHNELAKFYLKLIIKT